MMKRHNKYTHNLCPLQKGNAVTIQNHLNCWWNIMGKVIMALSDHQCWIWWIRQNYTEKQLFLEEGGISNYVLSHTKCTAWTHRLCQWHAYSYMDTYTPKHRHTHLIICLSVRRKLYCSKCNGEYYVFCNRQENSKFFKFLFQHTDEADTS